MLILSKTRQISRLLQNGHMLVKEIGADFEDPMIVVDHTSYPGVEAHLFTLAAAAQWSAGFTADHDVILSRMQAPIDAMKCEGSAQNESYAWNRLASVLTILVKQLKLYRNNIAHGEFATVVWGHHATEWHRELWDSKIHDHIPPTEFIEYVDPSIRSIITELNDLGFATVESCSGLLAEHPDRVPYKPYVMFDERSYYGSAPHFFTLGDMAGWESMYAPHGFDVYIRVIDGDDIEDAWSRLVTNARILGPLLTSYRKCNGKKSLSSKRFQQDSAQDADSTSSFDPVNQARRIRGVSGLQ